MHPPFALTHLLPLAAAMLLAACGGGGGGDADSAGSGNVAVSKKDRCRAL